MNKELSNKNRSSKSNPIIKCWEGIKTHALTFLYAITFIAIAVTIISFWFEKEIVTHVAFCVSLVLLFFTGTTSFTHTKSKILIDFYKECWEWIRTNIITIIITIAIVSVFLRFEKEIVEASFSYIGKIKESKFGVVLLWFLGFVLFGVMIYSIINKSIHKTLSDGRTFFLSLVLCSLFVYCGTKYPWKELIDQKINNPVKGYEWAFIVLFSVYALCFVFQPFILFFVVKHKTDLYKRLSASKQKGSFLSDTPITSKNEDELHFDAHVQALKTRIEEMPNTGTHSIAITGGWGTGKTSFLNLLEQELIAQGQYEIMWFNPLKSSKSGNIQNDFFDVLENTLSKYKLGFGRRIKYYKELIGAIDNKYVSFLVKLGSIQLEEEKKRINDVIKMIPKKFIIIIDDIDRLKGDEIMQIFRLVGFNAEFDNVVFLIPLDKANVVKALDCDPNYPDKFFEMEFPLPDNNRNATSLYIKKTLQKLVPDIPMGFLEDEHISLYTSYCISNLRDATRFINSFLDRVMMIYNKLDVCSFYLLYLIRYKSPTLYEQIKNQEFLEKKEVAGTHYLEVNEDYSIKDPVLNSITHRLFPQDTSFDSGRYIYQPKFFDDYFNDTSTKSISDATMTNLLFSESDEELQQTLNQITNDEISKQSLTDLWQDENTWESVKSLYNKNHQNRIITNYYRVFDYLEIDNELSYFKDLAAQKLNRNEYAIINNQGFAYVVKFDSSEDLALVNKSGEWILLNKEGKPVHLSPDNVREYHDDLALVRKDGKWGFLDKDGKLIILLEYDEVIRFYSGLARVKKGGKWGFLDKNGKLIIPLEYDDASDFYHGYARVKKDGKWGFLDKNGKLIIPMEYDNARDFYYSYAQVKKDGKWGLLDKDGKPFILLEYDYINDYTEGLALVKKNGKYGFMDKDGKLIIPLEYDDAMGLCDGYARVKKDGKCGFLDKDGKLIIPLEYDDASDFYHGYARVKKDGKWGLLEKNGKLIIPMEYDEVIRFYSGLARVKKDGKWGFLDKNGKLIIPLEYDDANDFDHDYARVKKDGKWGFLDKNGTFKVIAHHYAKPGKIK